jgi:NADPH:quinone reductase-like Zn-dependent oxidoreductase
VKAWVALRFGGPDVMVLREWKRPEPGHGEVLVRVRAVGLNFADLFARMGVYPLTPPPPFIPGLEFSGEVETAGEGVTELLPGTRVMGYSRHGSHAEYVAVQASLLLPVPGELSYQEAAAFPAVGMTAYHGLVRLAHLQKGEKLLIHAAAGGVGLATLQLARFLGAETFATAGSDEKLAVAARHGAQHVINYNTHDFAVEIRTLTDRHGVDVIMDSVGGKVFRKGWSLLAPMGRYVLFGVAAVTGEGGLNRLKAARVLGSMPPVFPSSLIGRNKGIFGFNLGTLTGKERYLREAADEIMHLLGQGVLRPIIGKVFPFSEMREAHRYLQSRQSVGKVVVTLE